MKLKKKHIVHMLLGAAFGAAGGYFGMQFGRGMGDFAPMDGPLQKTLTISTAFFALWFALAFHELAHLVTGLAQGFRFHLYVAGFLGVRRDAGTDRIQWYFNTDMQLFGGVAATLPYTSTSGLTRLFARVVIAGPVGSLVLAMFGGLTGWWLSGADAAGWRLLAVFLLVSAATSFLLFLATTVPSRTGMFFTDRARYFRLISGGQIAEIERAMLELTAYVQSGKPLEQLDMTTVDIARQDKDYARFAELYAYYHFLATGQTANAVAAAECLQDLPDEMPAAFQIEFWKEICFVEAYLKRDSESASHWWSKIEKHVTKRPDVTGLRAQAAVQYLNGQTEDARQTVEKALALLAKKQNLSATEQVEKSLLSILLERMPRTFPLLFNPLMHIPVE